jgi:hypothetical protein
MLILSGSLQLAVCTTVLLVATACSAILPDRYKKPGVKLNTAGHDYNRCLRQADADGIFTQKRDRRINAMIDKCMEANGYTIVHSK